MTLDRNKAARLTFGSSLIILLYRYLTHSLIHQLQQPVLFDSEFDYVYWLYQFSRFPTFIVQSKLGAYVFDLVLFLSSAYCFFTQARNRLSVIVCACSWFLYGLSYNAFVYHHSYAIVGMMLLPFAFFVRDQKNFLLVWEAARYFCLYIYVDAFFFKTVIGRDFFYFPSGAEFIKTNQSAYMLQNPETHLTAFYAFLLSHPGLSYTGFVIMVLLQGSMAIGFFTKKLDRYLFFVPILFHLINYLIIDVFFFELLVLNITLIPLKKEKSSI
jgi:hypothetical protein